MYRAPTFFCRFGRNGERCVGAKRVAQREVGRARGRFASHGHEPFVAWFPIRHENRI